jgi:hypothetical protein
MPLHREVSDGTSLSVHESEFLQPTARRSALAISRCESTVVCRSVGCHSVTKLRTSYREVVLEACLKGDSRPIVICLMRPWEVN